MTFGIPSVYTPELAEEICARLSAGKSLKSICRDPGMPPFSTVQGWARTNHCGFTALYNCARELQAQTQLSHQTKKYDLKSKHCGAQTDLGATRAKVVEALTEVRRAKIDGPALIFDDQLCELHSSNTDASTSASSRSMPNVLGKDSDF